MSLLRQFPAFVVLILISAGLMLVPALHATRLELWPAPAPSSIIPCSSCCSASCSGSRP